MRKVLKIAILLLLIVFLIGCGAPGDPLLDLYTANIYPGTANTYNIGSEDLPFNESWFNQVFVGTPTSLSIAANRPGGIIASEAIRSEAAVTAVAYDQGTGLWVSDYDTLVPDHRATGSFALTSGVFSDLFTSNTPIFEQSDADLKKFVVILSENDYGKAAEIINFIDANNVQLRTWGWDEDFTNAPFVVLEHPLLGIGASGRTTIWCGADDSFQIHTYNYTNGILNTTCLVAGSDDQTNLLVDVSANGYSDIDALEVEYNTGNVSGGELITVVTIDVDETGAVSSNSTTEIDFLEILTTDVNEAEKNAIHIGQSFNTAVTVSGGSEEDPDHGYEVTPDVPVDRVNGVAPDGTAFLEASASDLTIFDADEDYILIGSDATFEAIDAILVTGANQPILAEYYYSTGAGTWDTLSVTETTDDFTQSGTITFNAPGDWALSNLTEPAGAAINNAFYVKIVRTRNNLGLPPVESYFKTFPDSSLTDFEIRGDGTIRPVEMADAAAPNNSLYFSTTGGRLAYKDSVGVVHLLW
jgi:hypothetical protein